MKSETSKLHQAFVKELKEQMGLVKNQKKNFVLNEESTLGQMIFMMF